MFSDKHAVFSFNVRKSSDMVILNASFIIDAHQEGSLIERLRRYSRAWSEASVGRWRISALRDANGVDYAEAEAHTVAVQWEFNTLAEARVWRDSSLAEMVGQLKEAFGTELMVFTSIFELLADGPEAI